MDLAILNETNNGHIELRLDQPILLQHDESVEWDFRRGPVQHVLFFFLRVYYNDVSSGHPKSDPERLLLLLLLLSLLVAVVMLL